MRHGPGAGIDDEPGVLDRNDVVLFMFSDAGETRGVPPPQADHAVAVELYDPLGFPTRWAQVASFPGTPPRTSTTYVSYDPVLDRIHGSRVSLGFVDGVPQYLSVSPDGSNVLDRLKIRATATFLWGLIRVTRTEGDLLADPVGWKEGPIRVVRRQQHSIRVGFGIRSPRFGSYTYFYRDFADLPASVRLRVPPRVFFTSISVRAGLDFRSLPGEWRVLAPGPSSFSVDCPERSQALDGVSGSWFALRGDALTLVQRLERGPSLASVRQHIWYTADPQALDPPESQPGQCPGIGFVLDDWNGVEGGHHELVSTSYALPPDENVGTFLATLDSPLQPRIHAIR